MSRELIYKDDARKAVLKESPSVAYCIESIRVVDAVEVVRCKDCISHRNGWCYLNDISMIEDDFCSYGEKKE